LTHQLLTGSLNNYKNSNQLELSTNC
jgi:hypothetical protein